MHHLSRFFRFCLVLLMTCAATNLLSADEPSRDAAHPLTPELRKRCMLILRNGLKSDEFWPSMHAAEALTQAGAGAEVIEHLTPLLPAEKDDQRRCGLARELVRAGERKYLSVLFEILSDATSKGRGHAAESLFKVREVGDGKSLRVAMNQTEVIPLRIMAAGALAQSGDAEALALLRRELLSDNTTARNLSAWILGRCGDASDHPPLIKAMRTETDEMSLTFLAVSLACLNNVDGRAALVKHLDSPDNTARSMATEFISISRTYEAKARLIEMLDDPFGDVRIRASQSLITLSQPASP
jgi:sialidase-1